jgi:polysaccharide export outer membrane protein
MKILMIFALGFIVINQQAILKAQETGQGPAAGLTAHAQAAPSATPIAGPPSDEYLINPGDVLDVYVYDVPELSHTYTVSPSGAVTVPLLPTHLQAAGLTPDQFARAMEEALRQSGRLRRPEIAVSLKQSLASSVAVQGAVKNPLILPEIGRTTLVDIFTQCGGLADDAGTTVTITRGPLALRDLAAEGGVAAPTLTIELKKAMDVSDPASTIAVWPGDRVSVERERPDVYYVLGEVKSPGGYSLKRGHEDLTVLRALALAGDATGVAKRSKAMIIRKDPKGPQGREEIDLDLKNILLGKSPDPKLQADDILFVPGSGGKKALRTLEGVPAMVVGGAGEAAIVLH